MTRIEFANSSAGSTVSSPWVWSDVQTTRYIVGRLHIMALWLRQVSTFMQLSLAADLGFEAPPVVRILSGISPLIGAEIVTLTVLKMCLIQSYPDDMEYQFTEFFERCGVPMLSGRWISNGEVIITLIKLGLRDMQSYFTKHPDALTALRRQVLLKDVDAVAVQIIGTHDKSVFIGGLDQIRSDTDQTCISRLIAFECGEPSHRSEFHITKPDASALDCLFTAALSGYHERFRKILGSCFYFMNYKQGQEKLISAGADIACFARDRMIGPLTALIAYKFNSPLAAIVSNYGASVRWLDRLCPHFTEAISAMGHAVHDAILTWEVIARAGLLLSNSPRYPGPINRAQTVKSSIILIDYELLGDRSRLISRATSGSHLLSPIRPSFSKFWSI